MAAQDQVLQTKYHATKILQTETDNKADCTQSDETVQQNISAGRISAKDRYIKRHDRVCAELHCDIDRYIKRHDRVCAELHCDIDRYIKRHDRVCAELHCNIWK
jgi:hypothetical protein